MVISVCCYYADMTLFVVAAFALGAIVASFIGVVVGRLYTGESMVYGSSRCDACGRALGPRSLVPLFSYLLSRGRATCCGAQLSRSAPATELLLGVLFALLYVRLGATPVLALSLVSVALLAVLVLYDLAHQILPAVPLYLFVASSALTSYAAAPSLAELKGWAMVAAVFALFFAALHLFSRGRAMGLADTPLVFGLALLAGPYALTGFLLSFWIGGAVGIVILARTPRGSRMGIEVPFAPFLAAGFLLAYFIQWNLLPLDALVPTLTQVLHS